MKYTKEKEETTLYLTAYLVGVIFVRQIGKRVAHGFCDARVVEMRHSSRHQRRNRPHRRVGHPIGHRIGMVGVAVVSNDAGGSRDGCWV